VIAKGLLQCGSRKGRGCTDMIFADRQLMEKIWEHGNQFFLLFVELKKAYARNALWIILMCTTWV